MFCASVKTIPAFCLTCLAVACPVHGQGFQLNDSPGPNRLTFYGGIPSGALHATEQDRDGVPVGVGDFNDDGFLDQVLALNYIRVDNVPIGTTRRGETHIVFGSGAIGGATDLTDLNHNHVIVLGWPDQAPYADQVEVGDVNGDGIDDILLGTVEGDSPDFPLGGGSVFILFGNRGLHLASTIYLENPPPIVTRIGGGTTGPGPGPGNRTVGGNAALGGSSIHLADLTGDGIDDIITGAMEDDDTIIVPGGRTSNGSVFVLPGASIWPATIDIVNSPPPGFVHFQGAVAGDRVGGGLAVGDLNGDGKNDLAVGANWRSSPDYTYYLEGKVYLLFAPESEPWPSHIDAAYPPPAVRMSVLTGVLAADIRGERLVAADFNGDGTDDLALGNPVANNFEGVGFVIEGGRHLESRQIDLASPPSDFHTTVIEGGTPERRAFASIAAADLDKDGYSDLLIGVPEYAPNPGPRYIPGGNGRIEILFGAEGFWPQAIDLLSADACFRRSFIRGALTDDRLGDYLTTGDWNGDGYTDVVTSAIGSGARSLPSARRRAGKWYVVDGLMLASSGFTCTPTPTPTLSPTPTPTCGLSTNLVPDDFINAKDLLEYIRRWKSGLSETPPDFNCDGVVDHLDLYLFQQDWSLFSSPSF